MLTVLLFCSLYLVLFSFTDYVYIVQGLPSHVTKKIAHFFSGFIALAVPHYFESIWQVALAAMLFLAILYFSEKNHWFPSITGISKNSWGTWLFPIGILFCFSIMKVTDDKLLYFVPMVTLTVSDSLANVLGKKFPYIPYQIFKRKKTILGSFVFFCSTLIICYIYLHNQFSFSTLFGIAFIASIVEGISIYGLDNITLPVIMVLLLMFFN